MADIRKNSNKQIILGVVPTALSLLFVLKQSWVLLVFCVLSLFAIVGLVPLFRNRESLFMFLFVAAAGLPLNIAAAYSLVSDGYVDSGFLLGNVLWGLLLCCVLFCLEEIAFGVVTRLIWKRQYKLKIK